MSRLQLRALARQDKALAMRSKGSGESGVMQGRANGTNVRLVRASDGTLLPALDFSASKSTLGKPVRLTGNLIRTKVGHAGL